MSRLRRHLPLLALFLALAALTLLCVRGAASLAAVYPATSLRYAGGTSAEAAQAARRYAAQLPDEDALWPTFWAEARNTVDSDLFSAEANCVYVDGDAALAQGAQLTAGRLPAPLEDNTAAVSEGLAAALWGGRDVIGLPLSIGGKTYTVCGVLRGEHNAAVLGAQGTPPQGGWQAVELPGAGADIARNFAALSGLGTPDELVVGATLVKLATAMAWAPLVLLALYGGVCALRLIRLPRPAKHAAVFCALLALAVALPTLLAAVPGWLLPTRWSDFSHWPAVFAALRAGLLEWLRLTPSLKDAEARLLLGGQVVLLAANLVLLWPLCHKSRLARRAASPQNPASTSPQGAEMARG